MFESSHSGLIFAARITLPHFSVSSAMNLPKSAGEPASDNPSKSAVSEQRPTRPGSLRGAPERSAERAPGELIHACHSSSPGSGSSGRISSGPGLRMFPIIARKNAFRITSPPHAYFAASFSGSLTASKVANSIAQGWPSRFSILRI